MTYRGRIYKALSVAKLALSGEQVSEFDKAEALEAIVKEIARLDYEAEMQDPGKNHAAVAEYLENSAKAASARAAKQN